MEQVHTLESLVGGAMHLLFLSGLLLLLVRIAKTVRHERSAAPPPPSSRNIAIQFVRTLSVVAFAVLLWSFLRWQMAGHLDRRLAQLQQRFDVRPVSKQRVWLRGSLLDRNGLPIAESYEEAGAMQRGWAHGEAFSHLLGYDDPFFGRAGLEGAFSDELLGRTANSPEEAFFAARNMVVRERQQGAPVRLTLDARLQMTAYRELEGSNPGAVVMLRPQTGEVLALCSYPSFHPTDLNKLLESRRGKPQPAGMEAVLLNRALQGRYPPGSLLKVLPALVALEQGLLPVYESRKEGYMPPRSNKPVRDHEALGSGAASWQGHGKIGLDKALWVSSNTYFAKLGVELGFDAMEEKARGLGFHESFKLFGSPERNSYLGVQASAFPADMGKTAADTARVAIGQHRILATPLHMALLYSAIANGGELLQPSLVLGEAKRPIATVCSAATARKLRRALHGVIEEGTGVNSRIVGLEVAGKTGTAENPHGKGHAWFAAFAPAAAPTVCVVVLVENGGYGGQVAAPIARELLLSAAHLGYLGEQYLSLKEQQKGEKAQTLSPKTAD